MSVLNEVLKNLDEKGTSQRSYMVPSAVYKQYLMPWYIWLIMFLLASVSGYLAFQLSVSQKAVLDIPHDLYDFSIQHEKSSTQALVQAADKILKEPKPIEPKVVPKKEPVEVVSKIQPKPVAKPLNKEPFVLETPIQQSIVQKTIATQAEEDALDAYEDGKIQTVKKLIKHTQPGIQENFRLRIMLKEEPEKVLPYLKRNKPGFENHGELLALAAQAQQRSGDYRTSAIYYQRLIKTTPSEPRWHAGLAISLDGLGEKKKAVTIYRSVLKSNALPVPLRRFVKQRLTKLGRQNG